VSAIAALREGGAYLEDRNRCVNDNLTWVEVNLYDEQYPLTLNVVAMKKRNPTKVIYLLTSSSLNFRSSFFTPIEKSLAFYLAQNGYLVVGITPREDNVPLKADPGVMAKWGMRKHREDVRKVIRLVQALVGKPYHVLGHSLGAITALDYAGAYSDRQFRSVMLLDIPSFDPERQPDKIANARLALGAYNQLLRAGVYRDTAVTDYKLLLAAATFYPDVDSGWPRADLGLPGDFTFDGLLHFSLIFTASMPGIITELTGLPQEWPMVQGNIAGDYDFALNPTNDSFELTLTEVDRLGLVMAEVGSGIAPVALLRDYTSAIANLSNYRINWAGIQEKVIWINAELGMGAQTYGAKLIRRSGNTHVTVAVAPGYGHVDVIYSETARKDVWSRLLTP
jgi:pimeloyl-ACP methyl ester carboxylesterase